MQTITLVTEDGTEHEVRAHLSIHANSSGLRSWDGSFSGSDELFNVLGQTLTVRMPDGREGRATITDLNALGGGGFLQGSGPAPFGN